jgi:hypothetical protein
VVKKISYMNSRLFLPALALSALLSGCVGTGPNTQTGAVAGGVLGAIVGGVIGNNHGSGNAASGAAIGAAVGAIAGGTMGNAQDHQNGTVYGAPPPSQQVQYQNRTYTHVQTVTVPPRVPSAPRSMPTEQIPPSPSLEAVWIPGYWDYNGTSYVWTAGRWEIPPPGSTTYIAAHWETRMNTNVFVRGYWE